MATIRPNVTSPTELRRLLAEYGVRPAKRLGQSFLVDANIVANILGAAKVNRGDNVFEVGPGAGALTIALAEKASAVVALELDPRLVEMLQHLLGDALNVRIVAGDVLQANLAALLGDRTWKLLANLPYSVVGPAIARLIEHRRLFSLMLLMVQREMAQRLIAPPGSRSYGVLSVRVRAYARAEIVGQVNRTCFYPRPRVDSTLVRLTPLKRELVAPQLDKMFTAVVRAAFRQRRKMLLNALAGASDMALTREGAQQALAAARIEPCRRPESLSPEEFAALARATAEDSRGT